jgi:hypothetical protein
VRPDGATRSGPDRLGQYCSGKYGPRQHGTGKYGPGQHGTGKYGTGKHGTGLFTDRQ